MECFHNNSKKIKRKQILYIALFEMEETSLSQRKLDMQNIELSLVKR